MEKRNNMLKEAGVLFIATILVLTTLFVFTPLTERVKASTTIWSERFTGITVPSLPSGWSSTHPGNWKTANSAWADIAPELVFSWTPQDTAVFRVKTPQIDLTGYTDCYFKFWHRVNHFNGPYTLKVESSTDGTTWTTLWSLVNPVSCYGLVTIGPFTGANQYFAFTFDGDSYNINYWYIDTIVVSGTPVPTSIDVSVDIKPETWPNSLNTQKKGQLPVAICGTDEFDVTTIDPTTIEITREGLSAEVPPLRWSYKDVATPYPSDAGEGWALGADGYLDLCLKFDVLAVATGLELDDLVKGDIIPLSITGNLLEEYGGTAIEGYDYIVIVK